MCTDECRGANSAEGTEPLHLENCAFEYSLWQLGDLRLLVRCAVEGAHRNGATAEVHTLEVIAQQ